MTYLKNSKKDTILGWTQRFSKSNSVSHLYYSFIYEDAVSSYVVVSLFLFREDFTYFVELCFKMFGDRVKHWVTFNEPNLIVKLAYSIGAFPPNRCSEPYGKCDSGNSSTEPVCLLLNTHESCIICFPCSPSFSVQARWLCRNFITSKMVWTTKEYHRGPLGSKPSSVFRCSMVSIDSVTFHHTSILRLELTFDLHDWMLTWWYMLKQDLGSLVLWWLSSPDAPNLRSKLAKIYRRREETTEEPNWLHRGKSLPNILCQGLHIFSMWYGRLPFWSFSFYINRTKWDTHWKTGKNRHCILHYSIQQES